MPVCPNDNDCTFGLKNSKAGLTDTSYIPSLAAIKESIPARCFESSAVTSLYYTFKDISIALFLFCCSYFVCKQIQSTLFYYPFLILYIYVQGTYFTAFFVVGHDCGHGSFSKYTALNDLVGLVMHTFLLCPYFPWKLSHKVHHKNNCNIDKDEVFYPVRESQKSPNSLDLPYFGLFTGWFYYLIFGYQSRGQTHLSPFTKRHLSNFFNVVLSLVSLICWGYLTIRCCQLCGLSNMMIHYYGPVFVFGCYIVVITFLHHHDVGVPWYSDNEWDYVRGQLSSIDRSYGWCNDVIHHIGTHQLHHLFPIIPHYHLEEATRFFRAKFPHLARTCERGILSEFNHMYWKYSQKHVIDDRKLIHIY